MNERLAHYRVKCVSDFKLAEPGSIHLENYVEQFGNHQKIAELQKRNAELIKQGLSLKNSEERSQIARQLEHSTMRAVFPYRYVRYGISIFGSARLSPTDPEFKEVSRIARGIVEATGADMYIGGGPGIMEAACIGLKKAKQKVIKSHRPKNNGLTINLAYEPYPNDYLDVTSPHDTFGTRLNEFADKGNGTVSWDGGIGTDLENSFVFQLQQEGHLESDYPIVLKRSMWEPIIARKIETMYHRRIANDQKPLMSEKDLFPTCMTNDPNEVIDVIGNQYKLWKQNVWDKLDKESQLLVMSS
jgi:predicted Rossmann-fold nucleotide-binding protein